MSVLAAIDPTSRRQLWRAARTPVLLGLAVLLLLGLTLLSRDRTPRGALDPAAPSGAGGRALAVLLGQRGVAVQRVARVEPAAAAGDTVFVPLPNLLPAGALRGLRSAGADLVLADPSRAQLAELGSPVRPGRSTPVEGREPGCDLPAARAAGAVDLGGRTFNLQALPTTAARCYASGGAPTLVAYLDRSRTVTLLGSPELFTNDRLGRAGNAALALRLLGTSARLLWLRPSAAELLATPPGGRRGLLKLLPDRLLLAILQLFLGLGLVALWRARRLGPVVVEPLPVVVRSAEIVEGRGRLYRAARARDRAAAALRAGALARLVPALGLPADTTAAAVTVAVAAQTGRSPQELHPLLYGSAPADDAALVRLADKLDALDREVRRL